VLPGCYLLFVGCQGFPEPEPAKTEPLPQGLQSLRQTNNIQPKHEIRPTGKLGATLRKSHSSLGNPLVPESFGQGTKAQVRAYIRKEQALQKNEGLQRKNSSTG
jgi:hypothetical protein